MIRMGRILAMLLFLCLSATNGLACVPSQDDKEDPYVYGQAMIESLGSAHLALTRVSEPESPPKDINGIISEVTRVLAGMKQVKDDFHCSAQMISPFEKSKDE